MRRGLFRHAHARLYLAAAVGTAATFAAWLWFRHYAPDRERYPIRGIDVSHHQGPVDWQKVAADDVAFVYLKSHRRRRSPRPLLR